MNREIKIIFISNHMRSVSEIRTLFIMNHNESASTINILFIFYYKNSVSENLNQCQSVSNNFQYLPEIMLGMYSDIGILLLCMGSNNYV
ncbi:MAG: hypothetical protein COT43_03365 [Candidatus Marinimicrobia bacterium CG08_land_8_20_14_0_20_45_22]|nr:MAG: hypothetical protein COT43_03365 [Candidatus Marinimicrobia bacterium CG08_land_8_20_14_0_20_45_22]